MKLGYIGLGKMGKNMVLRLLEHQHQVVVWNRSPEPINDVVSQGAIGAPSLLELVNSLTPPRVIWLMLPAGSPTTQTIDQLLPHLTPGDTLIDGANSFYKDTVILGKKLRHHQINFLDVGVSGGPTGARNGACLMIGGDEPTFLSLTQLFQSIASPDAYQFFPGTGAGHFVKMIHNGIEYAMMQGIAEGFAILKESDYHFDLTKVAQIYNQNSVIQSRLIGWTKTGLEQFGQDLDEVSPTIAHSGEGEWTLKTAQEFKLETPAIKSAFQFRIDSQTKPSFTSKIVSMIRNQFGGHSVNH